MRRPPRSVQAGIKIVQAPKWVKGFSHLFSGARRNRYLEAFCLQLLPSVRNGLATGTE